MPLPSPKELAKLAKACRAAGITYFKADGIEFSLGDVPATLKASKLDKTKHTDTPDPVSEDVLTGDALLYWSSQDLPSQAVVTEEAS